MLDLECVAISPAVTLYIGLEPLHVPGLPPGSSEREQIARGKAQHNEIAQLSHSVKHTCLAAAILSQQQAQVAGPEFEVHQRTEVIGENPFQHRWIVPRIDRKPLWIQ